MTTQDQLRAKAEAIIRHPNQKWRQKQNQNGPCPHCLEILPDIEAALRAVAEEAAKVAEWNFLEPGWVRPQKGFASTSG